MIFQNATSLKMNANSVAEKVRIDRWLWAARFFKTRSMAAQAVSGGKVHVNGVRKKPANLVGIGDELRIRRGDYEFVIIIQGVSNKRGPAKEARLLYLETEESILARETLKEQRKLLKADPFAPTKRPDKKDRRLIRNFIRKDS